MSNFTKLNIGSGQKLIADAINIDIIDFPGGQKVDITCGLPFDNRSFQEVYADYVLCQIADRDTFKLVLNEIWRVLEPGGVLKLKVPNAKYPAAFNDPMDCRYFTRETFDYFNQEHYRYEAFNYGFEPWKILKIEAIGNYAKPKLKDRLYVEMQKGGDDENQRTAKRVYGEVVQGIDQERFSTDFVATIL